MLHRNKKSETIEKLSSETEVKINTNREEKNMNVRTGNKKEVMWILNTLIGIPIVLKNEYERWEYGVVLNEFKDGKLNLRIDDSIEYLVKLDGILN